MRLSHLYLFYVIWHCTYAYTFFGLRVNAVVPGRGRIVYISRDTNFKWDNALCVYNVIFHTWHYDTLPCIYVSIYDFTTKLRYNKYKTCYIFSVTSLFQNLLFKAANQNRTHHSIETCVIFSISKFSAVGIEIRRCRSYYN